MSWFKLICLLSLMNYIFLTKKICSTWPWGTNHNKIVCSWNSVEYPWSNVFRRMTGSNWPISSVYCIETTYHRRQLADWSVRVAGLRYNIISTSKLWMILIRAGHSADSLGNGAIEVHGSTILDGCRSPLSSSSIQTPPPPEIHPSFHNSNIQRDYCLIGTDRG